MDNLMGEFPGIFHWFTASMNLNKKGNINPGMRNTSQKKLFAFIATKLNKKKKTKNDRDFIHLLYLPNDW